MANLSKLRANFLGPFGLLLALLAISQVSLAGVGDIDPAFGSNGVYVNPGQYSELPFLPDGGMVSASYSNGLLRVHRADADGHPELTFGRAGTADIQVNFTSMDWVYRTAVAPDGSTFHASPNAVVHVVASGVLDTDFGSAGVRSITPQDVAVTAPVLISSIAPLAAGSLAMLVSYGTSDVYACPTGWKILRLLRNGQVDDSFGNGGTVPVPAVTQDCNESGSKSIEALADGYLRIVDWYCSICDQVIDARGTAVQLPTTVVARLNGPVFQSDSGRTRNYLVGVSAVNPSDVLVARLNADLSVDPSFGASGNGFTVVRFPQHVQEPVVYSTTGSQPVLYIQAKVIGWGRTAVFRLLADGSLDPVFNGIGMLTLPMMDAGQIQHAGVDGSLTFRSRRADGDSNPLYAFRTLGQNIPSPGAFNVDGPGFSGMIYGNTVNISRVLGNVGAARVSYTISPKYNASAQGALSTLAEGQLNWENGETGSKSVTLPNPAGAISTQYFQVDLQEPAGAALLQSRGSLDLQSRPALTYGPSPNVPNVVATPPSSAPVTGGGGAFGLGSLLLCGLLCASRRLS